MLTTWLNFTGPAQLHPFLTARSCTLPKSFLPSPLAPGPIYCCHSAGATSMPTPSRKKSMGRSLMTGKHQTNYIPGTEGRREWPFLSLSLAPEATGGCSSKYLLICKWPKASQEILEILQFTPHTVTVFIKVDKVLERIFHLLVPFSYLNHI